MNRKAIPALLLLSALFTCPANTITGFWKSMDADTGLPAAVIGIYEYSGMVFGRLIITYENGILKDTLYNRTERAEMVEGEPYYAGLDFIWDLEERNRKWTNGRIMDPQEGKIYHSEMWLDEGCLVVRGKIKIGFISLGKNQIWLPANRSDLPSDFVLPDLTEFTPVYSRPKTR